MAWARHGHGMASANQTRPYCEYQMGKTHSKPLAARHVNGKAWARHGHGMLCVDRPLICFEEEYLFVYNLSYRRDEIKRDTEKNTASKVRQELKLYFC